MPNYIIDVSFGAYAQLEIDATSPEAAKEQVQFELETTLGWVDGSNLQYYTITNIEEE